MKARTIGRSARSGRYMAAAKARGRKDAVVETRARDRDGETLREIVALASAMGRVEAVLASVDRRLANLEAIGKDTRAGGRKNHAPDWMSA